MPGWKEKLNKLTVTVLKKICSNFKIKGYSNKKKPGLISLILRQVEHQSEMQKMIDSEFNKKVAKAKKPSRAGVSKEPPSLKARGPIDSIIIQLTKTVNQLISFTNGQFKKIDSKIEQFNQRLQELEKINKIQPKAMIERKKIKLNAKKLSKIIGNISRQNKGDYLTFYDLRRYLNKYYIIENDDWEQYLEELRNKAIIEFSKGAKKDEWDVGYKDAFNRTYYYFKLK